MKITQVKIKNFRGIKDSTLFFNEKNVLIGDNNVGKSTIFEALNLVLGPDRIFGPDTINEHDFFGSQYLDEEGYQVFIQIEVVVSDLSDIQRRYFNSNLEFWDTNEKCIVTDPPIEMVDKETIVPVLRVVFRGNYNKDEDDFEANTYFSSSIIEGSEPTKFSKSAKRKCGFLYLRALRTGNRALSLEKGSLLDLILRLKEIRPQMWEDVINELETIPVASNEELGISLILKEIQEEIREFVPGDWGKDPHLKVSRLTRTHLRKTLTVFMATGIKVGDKQHYAPYYNLGTGTINILVLSLLSMVASVKQSVIFAMEEPETAIPPYTQKRIIYAVQENSAQSFFTTHSPYVLEEFDPKDILVLSRNKEGILSGTPFSYPKIIKPKAYSLEFRKRFAEALLSRRILIAEGATEAHSYPLAAKKLAKENPQLYKSLGALGVSVFNSETDGQIANYGKLFTSLGKEVYAVFDKQDSKELTDRIVKNVELAFEAPAKGFEKLIIAELSIDKKRDFLRALIAEDNWPVDLEDRKADVEGNTKKINKILLKLFKRTKAEGLAAKLLWNCNEKEMPITIKNVIRTLTKSLSKTEDRSRDKIEEEE